MSFKQIYNNKEYDLANLTDTEKSELGLKTLSAYVESEYITSINSNSELYKSEKGSIYYPKYFDNSVKVITSEGTVNVDWGNIENTKIDFKKEINTQNSNKKTISLFADRISCPECFLYAGGSVDSSNSEQEPKWLSYINANDVEDFSISLSRSGNNIQLKDKDGNIMTSLNTLALIINIQGPGADGGGSHWQGMFPSRANGGGGGGGGAFVSLYVNFENNYKYTKLYISKDSSRGILVSTSSGQNNGPSLYLTGPTNGEDKNENASASGGSGGIVKVYSPSECFRPLLTVDGGNGGNGGLSTSTAGVSMVDSSAGNSVTGKYYLFPSISEDKYTQIKKPGGSKGNLSGKENTLFATHTCASGGGGGASLASRGLNGGEAYLIIHGNGNVDGSAREGESAGNYNHGAGGGGGAAYSSGGATGIGGDDYNGKGGRGFVAIYY